MLTYRNGENGILINNRLIGSVSESKPYIAKNIALQWCALAANIVMIGSICRLLERLYTGCAGGGDLLLTAALTLLAVAVRFVCHVGAARMGYLSSKAVKKTLRQNMYRKLLRLGAAYKERVQTSEVVQVAVEGVQGKGMTRKTKVRIMVTVTILMSIGFLMMHQVVVGRIVLGCVWVFHVLYFTFAVKTIPESSKQEKDQ